METLVAIKTMADLGIATQNLMLAFAIVGDMLCFAVIAITTLRQNAYIRNPDTTILIVLGVMFIIPMLVRAVRRVRQPV